jgi:mono/diheme cytochrome c family protein
MQPIRLALIGMAFAAAVCGLALADSAGVVGANTFPERDGPAIYAAICEGCHMPDAKGAVGAGAYPALAGDKNLALAGYPVLLVLYGHKAMPGFGGFLDDAQVAAVVDYVRTHFGNDYKDAVTPADVKAARQPDYPYFTLD